MEIQGKTLKLVPKIVAADSPVADEPQEAGADLEKIYRDLYNFQMCEYCGIPTEKKVYCSEACFVSDMQSS